MDRSILVPPPLPPTPGCIRYDWLRVFRDLVHVCYLLGTGGVGVGKVRCVRGWGLFHYFIIYVPRIALYVKAWWVSFCL